MNSLGAPVGRLIENQAEVRVLLFNLTYLLESLTFESDGSLSRSVFAQGPVDGDGFQPNLNTTISGAARAFCSADAKSSIRLEALAPVPRQAAIVQLTVTFRPDLTTDHYRAQRTFHLPPQSST